MKWLPLGFEQLILNLLWWYFQLHRWPEHANASSVCTHELNSKQKNLQIDFEEKDRILETLCIGSCPILVSHHLARGMEKINKWINNAVCIYLVHANCAQFVDAQILFQNNGYTKFIDIPPSIPLSSLDFTYLSTLESKNASPNVQTENKTKNKMDG